MNDLVYCHSGVEYAERPIAFEWEGKRLEIAEILASWRLPDGKLFRVKTAEGCIFELTYAALEDQWRIHQP